MLNHIFIYPNCNITDGREAKTQEQRGRMQTWAEGWQNIKCTSKSVRLAICRDPTARKPKSIKSRLCPYICELSWMIVEFPSANTVSTMDKVKV